LNLDAYEWLWLVNLILLCIIGRWVLYPYLKSVTAMNRDSVSSIDVIKPDQEMTCVLCSQPSTRDVQLVRGDAGAICVNCINASQELLDSGSADNSNHFYEGLVTKLVNTSDTALESNLIDFLIRQMNSSPESESEIVAALAVARSHSYLSKLLEGKPRDKWTVNNVINWIWANCRTGEFEKANDYPNPIDRETLVSNKALSRHFELNKIAVSIEVDQSEENLLSALLSLSEIQNALKSTEYPLASDATNLLPSVLGTTARCHYLLNDYDGCLKAIELSGERAEPSDYIELLTGNAYEKTSDIDQAIIHWEKGLKDPHLSDYYQTELNRSLARVKLETEPV